MAYELPPHYDRIKSDEIRFFAENENGCENLTLQLQNDRLEKELKFANIEIERLRHQIHETIMENLHLADGDNCTLKRLKDAINFDDDYE
jgi:hypothetical protein